MTDIVSIMPILTIGFAAGWVIRAILDRAQPVDMSDDTLRKILVERQVRAGMARLYGDQLKEEVAQEAVQKVKEIIPR